MKEFKPEIRSHWSMLASNAQHLATGRMFANMMRQQYQHNQNQAGDDWCNVGHNWLRYMRVEAYELMEHFNSFKHWKPHSPDVLQARIELVDILIFAMSRAIESRLPLQFIERLDRAFAQVGEIAEEIRAEELNLACERLVETSFRGAVDTDAIAAMAQCLGLNAKSLVGIYEAKMALNHIRTVNGYKEGTYLKTWFGEEDNVVMHDSILNNVAIMRSVYSGSDDDVQGNLRLVLQQMYERAVEHHESR